MIPRIVHAVWVGSEVPAWVRRRWELWDRWCEARGYEFRGWSDEDDLERTDSLGEYPHPVCRADFARLEIVSRIGGMYVDSDTVPLPGARADDLFGDRNPWTVPTIHPYKFEVNNGCFAFPTEHPLLDELWMLGADRLARGYKRISTICGPPIWTDVAQRYPDVLDLLDPDRFYATMNLERYSLEDLTRMYPSRLMVHEFEQSWQVGYDGHGKHKKMPKWERRLTTRGDEQ